MLARYLGPGSWGWEHRADAGFMSGRAERQWRFHGVTYDIYGALINKKADDKQYVSMGRWSTVIGVAVSVVQHTL